MRKLINPILSSAVVMALALAAVFGAMSLANPAYAATPSGLTATGADNSVVLKFRDQTGINADNWEVQHREDEVGVAYSDWADADEAPYAVTAEPITGTEPVTSSSMVTVTVSGLANESEYCFRVREQATDGSPSGAAGPVCAVPNEPPDITAYSEFTVEPGDDGGSLDVEWEAAESKQDAWQYRVDVDADYDSSTDAKMGNWRMVPGVTNDDEGEFTISNLESLPTTVMIRPVALYDTGNITGFEGGGTDTANPVVAVPVPAKPTVTAKAGNGMVTLSWKPAYMDSGIKGWEYRHDTTADFTDDGEGWTSVPALSSDGTEIASGNSGFTDAWKAMRMVEVPDLDNDTEYTFVVRAVSEGPAIGTADTSEADDEGGDASDQEMATPVEPTQSTLKEGGIPNPPMLGIGDAEVKDLSMYFNQGAGSGAIERYDVIVAGTDNVAVTGTRAAMDGTRYTETGVITVTGLREGIAVVTVIAVAEDSDNFDDVSASFTVTVGDVAEAVNTAAARSGFITDRTLTVGASQTLDVSNYFTDGEGNGQITNYTFMSDDAAVTVNAESAVGRLDITAAAVGEATITVYAVDGNTADNPMQTFNVTVEATPVDPDEGSTAASVSGTGIPTQSVTIGTATVVDEATVMAAFTAGTGTGMIASYSVSSTGGSSLIAQYVTGHGVLLNGYNAGGALVTVTAHDGHGAADPSVTFLVNIVEPDAVVVDAPYTPRTPMGSMVDPMSDAYTFTASSDEPGDGARYDIKIAVMGAIDTLNDELEIKLEDFGFPSSVSPSDIGITVNEEDGAGQDRRFSPDTVTAGSDKLTITLGDMLTRDDDREDFEISAGSNIDIVIRQSAGITNPTEAKGDDYGPKVTIGTEVIDGFENNADYPMMQLRVPHVVKLSEEDGGVGDILTVEGLGFKNGTTIHFFVDKDEDMFLDPDEDVLCSDPIVGGDDVGSCEFTVTTPTFSGGRNVVNAVDGRDNYDIDPDGDQEFVLKPSLTATPEGGSPGELILIQLSTFPQGAVTRVTIGGVDLDKNAFSGSVNSQGSGSFSITVPNWAKAGQQQLKVWAGGESADTNIVISGPAIQVTPGSVLANQRISLVGTGFSSNASIARVGAGLRQVSKISISGEDIAWARINGGEPVDVDSGGNWSASVDLPFTDATIGSGDRIVRVTDSGGRTGSVDVTIPERTITITPDAGRVGTLAVVRGENFPSKNDEGSSFNIEIVYDAGNDKTTTVSAVPDASGRFEAQIRIPSTAAIPSSNQITVTFEDDDDRAVPTSVTHEVPEAEIQLSASSGGPGTQLTINGIGFKAFVPVNVVKIGTVDITPAPKPTTDGNGMVSFSVIIPGLDVGIQTLEMEVGRTTASIGFTVTESGINPGDIVEIAAGLEELGDNIVSAWHFNNDSKVWSFYDPTLEEGNTLTHMISGETYLIRVKSTVEVILNHDTRSLTCVGDNCWNQIVW